MNDLFKNFPTTTEQEWKTAVQTELKGADYAENLVTSLPEGFDIKPLYTHNDVTHSDFLTQQNQWKIVSQFVSNSSIPYDILDGVVLKSNQISEFKTADNDLVINEYHDELPQIKFHKPYISWDFLTDLAFSGNFIEHSEEKTIQHFKNIFAQDISKNTLAIHLSDFQNAGANHVKQLAMMLLLGAEYMNLFQDSKILEKPFVKNASGQNFFLEIAKLRAMRILWENFCKAYNVDSELFILTETTLRNKSVMDKYNNIIRSTFESAAGIFGNSDAVLVLPYDELFVESKESTVELSYKQQFILREESFLNQYIDPLKGAYFVEFLTEQLARKAWELFKKLEKNGGFLNGLKNESIQNLIEKSANIEQEKFNNREINLIGVNRFPNKKDEILASQIQSKKENKQQVLFKTIQKKRLAESTEKDFIQ